ncbi:MAG: STAS domain-containing protein [Chitinophagales bacterium]|nr:STAS domain-containing protein [Chitinophagales bacterium]MDW8393733.1 STAS domain-containing protein [Chitinophagales bacterium]
MTFRNQRLDDLLIIMPEGRILKEQDTAELRQWLREQLNGTTLKVIFDLKGVDFVNSACLNLLVFSRNLIQQNNGQLILCNVPVQLRQLLEITKLSDCFATADRTAEAMAMLK